MTNIAKKIKLELIQQKSMVLEEATGYSDVSSDFIKEMEYIVEYTIQRYNEILNEEFSELAKEVTPSTALSTVKEKPIKMKKIAKLESYSNE